MVDENDPAYLELLAQAEEGGGVDLTPFLNNTLGSGNIFLDAQQAGVGANLSVSGVPIDFETGPVTTTDLFGNPLTVRTGQPSQAFVQNVEAGFVTRPLSDAAVQNFTDASIRATQEATAEQTNEVSNDGTSPDGVDGSDFINEQSKFEKQAAEEGNSDDTGKQPNRLDEFLQDDDAIDQVSNQIKLSLEESKFSDRAV